MANILSQQNLETIAGVVGARLDVGVTAVNEAATESSRRVDNCYVKEETNNLISKAQKVFISETAPTSESSVGLYYVGTAQPYNSYLVDSNGVVTEMGSADIDLSDYQTDEDEELNTESKEVVGAINELKSSLTSVSFPVGMIMPTLSNEVPDGWLLCDGSEYPWFQNGKTTEYYALYNVIRFSYGGDGQIFKVPDLRARFLEGASSTAGHTIGKYVAAGLPDHNHVFTGTRTTDESKTPSLSFSGTNTTSKIAMGSSWGGMADGISGCTGGFSASYTASNYQWTGLTANKAAVQKVTYSITPAGTISGSHQHYFTPSGSINNASANNSAYGANSTVQPKSLCVNYLIKY